MSGRPLRFLGATTVGWIALRAVMLWPAVGPAGLPRALVPAAFADSAPAAPLHWLPAPNARTTPRRFMAISTRPIAAGQITVAPPALTTPESAPLPRSPNPESPQDIARPSPVLALPPPMTPGRAAAGRWSASGWFVLRDGRGIAPGLGSGQLGGSQAGLRIAYAIGNAQRIAVVARVVSPLHGRGREAAIGMEWRPTRLPIRIAAEYRASLDGGPNGPAIGVIAGTGPAPVAAGFDLETYGQAGLIRRRQTEAYAEGSARLARPLVSLGGVRFDIGLGGWGGAQRGARRLDVGPSLGARVPVGRGAIRVSLDWRQRIAGDARPGSGPVLVIGGDF